ncbi:hypothetical protein KUL118_59140 [Tenacibaculum sp. KUL118]|nr:hypothetical protein KUL118_59140 [Tenacibaculum sp. KUL118]
MKKLSILTPCYNSENYIEDTLQTVLQNRAVQERKVELEYILCDGGSNDRTVDVVQKLLQKYKAKNISHKIISEKDNGMYDALSKGFKEVTGDFCAYINAADLYSPYAFDVVNNVFSNNSNVKWLTGRAVIYSWEKVQVFNRLPFKYRANLIQAGFYGSQFPHIQQESTFWVSDLLDSVNIDYLKSLRLAGDLFLWSEFSKQAELYIVNTWLGGYRHHEGALSADMTSYKNEVAGFIKAPVEADFMQAESDKRFWDASDDIKVARNRNFFLAYDRKKGVFC